MIAIELIEKNIFWLSIYITHIFPINAHLWHQIMYSRWKLETEELRWRHHCPLSMNHWFDCDLSPSFSLIVFPQMCHRNTKFLCINMNIRHRWLKPNTLLIKKITWRNKYNYPHIYQCVIRFYWRKQIKNVVTELKISRCDKSEERQSDSIFSRAFLNRCHRLRIETFLWKNLNVINEVEVRENSRYCKEREWLSHQSIDNSNLIKWIFIFQNL